MITISLTDLLLGLLILAGTGALIALMVLLIKAVPAVKHLTKVLENAAVISDDAVAGVADAKELVGTVRETADEICGAAKGSAVKALVDLAKGIGNIAALINAKTGKNKEEK